MRADRAVEVASNGTRYPLRTNARHRGPLSGDLQPKLERTDWDPVIVDESHKEVVALLEENRSKLDSLASALLEHETLDEEDAYAAAGVPRDKAPSADSYSAAARSRTDA